MFDVPLTLLSDTAAIVPCSIVEERSSRTNPFVERCLHQHAIVQSKGKVRRIMSFFQRFVFSITMLLTSGSI